MRPEHQILILVARPALAKEVTARLRQLLQQLLDWEYLLATAEQHCLIPSLHYRLISECPEALPPQVTLRLGEINHEITRFGFFLTGELLNLITLLEAHDIKAVPFKGPTLALCAYGDVGRRQFGDLDILVRKKDVLRLKELLISHGYKPTPELTNPQQAALLRFDCAYNFDNGRGVMLDVHWDFVDRHSSFVIDSNPLWDRLEPVTIGGQQLLTLSLEDLLLILCLHGFTHFWERLGLVCDLASLIDRRDDLNWELVLQNANRLGLRRILLLGLLLAADLLDAPIPAEIQQTASADATVKSLASQVQQQLFLERRPPEGIFGGAILNLRMRERKRDKLRSCFRLVATPRSYDWMFLSLPDSLFFLYYLLRPLRLAGKYGAKLLRGSHDRRTPTKANRGALR